MKPGHLSQYFADFAFKRLSAVEADRHRSNQHEFDGVAALKATLGTERRSFPATFVYLNDELSGPISEPGFLTWYDARENHIKRSEWRLYFPDTIVSDHAAEDDLLVIARKQDDSLVVIIAAGKSTSERQLIWLFGSRDLLDDAFLIGAESEIDQVRLEFASRYILEQIGVELVDVSQDALLDDMLRRFGNEFPTARVFSKYARSTLEGIDESADADGALVAWLEREEQLFRMLERHLIGDRLKAGFDDVDEFISFSLSVQNRRKSRAGMSLENHLEEVWQRRKVRHSRTATTEGKAKPDFLFPGELNYSNPAFPASLLTMLAAKSTCKDRWRQILAEADRINLKHLVTLEPSISGAQTAEMQSRSVQLVVPTSIHPTYSREQRSWLKSVEDFLVTVAERQAASDKL